VAKKILAKHKVEIIVYTLAVGDTYAKNIDYNAIDQNAVRTADAQMASVMIAKIEEARKSGDSLGSQLACVVKNCPPGLGDPCFDKLNACLAHALMSIAAVKGVEFGEGFGVSLSTGSVNNDRFILKGQKGRHTRHSQLFVGTATNHAGGIIGGISTGEDIIIRMALKPPSSISLPQKTLKYKTPYDDEEIGPFEKHQEVEVQVKGRHDPCLAPRIVPVAEAMIALTLVDCLLIQKATNL
jgi:chorismate synthase